MIPDLLVPPVPQVRQVLLAIPDLPDRPVQQALQVLLAIPDLPVPQEL